MTKNQKAALRCYSDIGGFEIPPANQGQLVQISYGCSEEYIYERALDQTDRTVTVTAYRHPRRECGFEPWNVEPETGRRVGVIYIGPENDEPSRGDETS